MISCTEFRSRLQPSSDEPALLEHVRSCESCLQYGITIDPDLLFRSLGGAEMTPPNGIDAFVQDVMDGVRLQAKQDVMTVPAHHGVMRHLALAATLAAAITGASIVYEQRARHDDGPMTVDRAVVTAPLFEEVTRPIIESYDSKNATIIEVPPGEGMSDVKIVMIFDESLPADL